MKTEREARGWSTTKLADEARTIARREGSGLKLTQQTVSGFEQPERGKRIPEWMKYVRMAFDEADDPPPTPDLPVIRTVDAGDTVEITRLDLSLPMGPGALVEDYVEQEPVVFDQGYLRAFTRTPPHRLRLARGVGDSMEPTLRTEDQVWIDTTQNSLLHSDRIYAASINGGAAIKRLRPIEGGRRVLVISDNKTIEPYPVDAGEVKIWGRVIRFAREL